MQLFADSFDLYAATADAIAGYWDAGAAAGSLGTGRFSGSRGWVTGGSSSTTNQFQKSSGANDAMHHIVVSFDQTAAISGTNNVFWMTLYDGATAQCSIVFRSDGAILLTSGASSGAALATYTGAVTASNTWYGFEIEVLISNTAGYMNVRKNGNTSNDFASATNLNTRAGTTNSYSNRLGIGAQTAGAVVDDLLWRSDAAAVPWVGDVRCFTRMPASDVQAQWTPSTGTSNSGCVDEAQQNAATDYVFSSTVGQNDLYAIAAIGSTPSSIVAVTTRAFCQKSDAGTRNAAVQLRSGGTTVQGASVALSSSGWGWLSRTDTVDPATGAAWTPTAVNNAQIGCVVTA